MTGTARKPFHDTAMMLLVVAALLILLIGIYLHEIQALLPIASMLLALRICMQSHDHNARRFSGALTFYFAASTISNIAWYLVPALFDYSFIQSDYYFYVTGMFWIIGYVAMACVLFQLKNSRQWYIERRLDRGLTIAGATISLLIAMLVILNIDWSSSHLIDIFILLVYLSMDVMILMLTVKLLSMNLKIELRHLLLAAMLFFLINMAGDLLFEGRWLFHLSQLMTLQIGNYQTTLTIRNATNDIYNLSLMVMTVLLSLFTFDPLRARAVDEMRGKLKDTQLFVDDLIAKSPDATCIFDHGGRLVLVNDAFLQIFGLKRKDLDRSLNIFTRIGTNLFDDETYAEILKVRALDTVIIPRLKVKSIPGGRQENFYLYLKMFPTCGSDGRVVNYVLIIEDITARMEMEMALRQSEEKFRVLAETSPAAICLFRDDQFLYVNPAVERISGYSREEFAGMKLWDLLTPEYRNLLKERLDARKNGVTVPSSYEIQFISKSNGLKWVNISVGAVDINDMPAFMVSAFDITERKQAEKALRESEEKFRTLAEMAPMAIGILQDGRFKYTNPAMETITGYGKEELRSIYFMDMVHDNSRKYVEKLYSDWLDGVIGGPSRSVITGMRKDMNLYWFDASWKTIDYEGRRALLLTGVDVTERKQAEEALRESQRFQSTLISNLPGMVYRCRNDARWTMEYVSEGCTKLTGYEPADILQNRLLSFNDLIHPDDRDHVRNIIQETLDLRAPFQITYRIRTRQGDEKWVWEQGRFAGPGSPGVIEGFITDITDRRQAEEALRESEEKFRAIFEQTLQFIGLLAIDGTLLEANSSALTYVGASESDVVGKPFWDTPWWAHSPDLQARLRDAVADAAAGMIVRFETTFQASDGRLNNFDFSLKPVADESGNIVLLIPEGRDITERKRAEEALRESEARYRTLIDNSPLGILTCDLEGNITSINPQILEILGSKSPEFTMSVNLLNFEPVIKFGLVGILRECIIAGESRVAEKGYTSYWGKSVYLRLLLTPLRDRTGQIYSVLLVMDDITERKRLEDDLRKAYSSLKEEYARKIDFTNAAAHELRTPLTPIIGYTDILKAEVKDDRHRQFLEIIERNALRQKTLVNRMLELASLDAGMAHVNCSEMAVRPLAIEIADNYRTVNPNIRVEVPEGMLINTDPDILRHVLDNLVSNAVKFSDSHKEIVIKVVEASDSYQFSVKDHGAGIPKEEWGKIFERFYIVGGDSDSRTSGRSGLGLALVKAYIRLIGGNVWLESAPGEGSTFFFTVPRKPLSGDQDH